MQYNLHIVNNLTRKIFVLFSIIKLKKINQKNHVEKRKAPPPPIWCKIVMVRLSALKKKVKNQVKRKPFTKKKTNKTKRKKKVNISKSHKRKSIKQR